MPDRRIKSSPVFCKPTPHPIRTLKKFPMNILTFSLHILTADALVSTGLAKLGYNYVNIGNQLTRFPYLIFILSRF